MTIEYLQLSNVHIAIDILLYSDISAHDIVKVYVIPGYRIGDCLTGNYHLILIQHFKHAVIKSASVTFIPTII